MENHLEIPASLAGNRVTRVRVSIGSGDNKQNCRELKYRASDMIISTIILI